MIQPNDPEDPGSATLATTRRTPEIPDPPEMREPASPSEPPATPPTAAPRPSGRRWLPIAGVVLAILVLGTAGVWIYRTRPAAAPAAGPGSSAPEAVPSELRPYLDQAKLGDAKAMHMIALMYWNGLNVRQDRVRGLEWYRKAATAGSTAAQQFLKDNGIQ